MPADPVARLLIVDDEAPLMKALCDTLEGEGYSTTGFTSANAALNALREQTFDLVLSDLMMPEMDGIALMRSAIDIDPNLVGIVMTGHGTIDTAVQAMQAGALDYILKPFKLTAILPVLTRALAVRRLRLENIQLHEAVGIYKLSMAVAFAFDLDAVLQRVAEAALAQTHVKGVAILMPSDEDLIPEKEAGAELRIAVAAGEDAGWFAGGRIPFSPALSGWVERSRERLGREDQTIAASPLPELPNGLSIPMLAGGRFVGILNLNILNPRSGPPSVAPGQGKALTVLASAAASAIERASLLEQLRRAEQRYRRLTENAPDIVFRYELHPRPGFRYVSPAVTSITGYSPDEFYADRALAMRLVHPEDQPLMEKMLGGVFSSESDITVRCVHRNGHALWLEQRTIAVHDEQGHLIAIEGIARDVTSRRQLEEELRHAQKMDAIGRLAGGIAHDFNNLLTVINGYSELLLSEFAEPSPVQEQLTEIKRAGEHAAALTRQLLAFSRKQVLQPRVLNVNKIVESNSKILRRIIGADIELVTKLDPALGAIKADTGQIEQILMNLLVNSRDAMPKGGRVTIETRNVGEADIPSDGDFSGRCGPHVTLSVSDTGLGMDAATQARIFEPFFTTKESGRGTGLGLSIVYGVVKRSNGTIQVFSQPGEGTTFTIYLPRVEDAQTDLENAAALARTPSGAETILLVEDNPVVRQLISTTLERSGYRVLSARNGKEALRVVAQERRKPGLIITDLVMPEMSGADLVATLQKENPGLNILYISGYADDTVVRRGPLDPGIPFLQKPFTAGDLLARVRQAMEQKSRTAGAGAHTHLL